MNDEIEMYFDNSDSTSYIESLAKTRQYLKNTSLLTKLDSLIDKEIDLAILGADKAKSEILKKNKEDTVRPIK